MKYLIDSDFLFGLFVAHDPRHKKTTSLLKSLAGKEHELVVSNLVVQETATVLSRKGNQGTAIFFLSELSKMPVEVLYIGEDDENSGWQIFKKQTKKGTSFVDCANLAVAEKYKLDGILSFDKFYPKNVRIV